MKEEEERGGRGGAREGGVRRKTTKKRWGGTGYTTFQLTTAPIIKSKSKQHEWEKRVLCLRLEPLTETNVDHIPLL